MVPFQAVRLTSSKYIPYLVQLGRRKKEKSNNLNTPIGGPGSLTVLVDQIRENKTIFPGSNRANRDAYTNKKFST